MDIERTLFRVQPDDPDRCEAVGNTGQCPYRRTEGTKYCPRHCGPVNQHYQQKDEIRNFRSKIWQSRINEFADNEKAKSLREEIGILRLTLEALLDRCPDPQTLYLNAYKIKDLVLSIDKVVGSCHRLEEATGQLLDKTMMINFSGKVVEIIAKHIKDEKSVDKIATEMLETLAALTKVSEE